MQKHPAILPPFKVDFIVRALNSDLLVLNYGLDMMNVPSKWNETEGEGVKIGIIDTGLPSGIVRGTVHRDLDHSIADAKNFTRSPLTDAEVGHSTHVAGIIAASPREQDGGLIGIAPKAKLYIAKALEDSGGGGDDQIAAAVDWCAEQGCQLINMSLGAEWKFARFLSKTKSATKAASEAGCFPICASGNSAANKVGVPARWDWNMAVAAVNNKKDHASFSNSGQAIDFAAAGVEVLSTYKNGTYAALSGTSMATPQITGLCALILSSHMRGTDSQTPVTSMKSLIEHLQRMAIDVGQEGWDKDTGYGVPVFGKVNPADPTQPPTETGGGALWNWFEALLRLIGQRLEKRVWTATR